MKRWRIGPGWSIVLLLSGLMFTAGTVYVSFLNSPYSDGISTTGAVTDLTEQKTTSRNRVTIRYERIVTFETRDHRRITFDAQGYSSAGEPYIGEPVGVSYRPDNPEGARLIIPVAAADTWFERFLMAVGALITLAGLNGFVRSFAPRLLPAGPAAHPAYP